MKTYKKIFLFIGLAAAFIFFGFDAVASDDYANNLTAEKIIENIFKSKLAQEYEITSEHRLYPYLLNCVREAMQLADQQGLLDAKACPENCIFTARIIVKVAIKENMSRFISEIDPSILGYVVAAIVKHRLKSADYVLDKITREDGRSFSEKLAELNIQEEDLSDKIERKLDGEDKIRYRNGQLTMRQIIENDPDIFIKIIKQLSK